ncbi:unnamed protein product [Leptidea sinapis]|uniref:Oxidoreductase FAD/NAD(P)-binding domain-containing protein n=1 Tax=Leptidea sinapis TaxID=189913 RepID=A0A5E4QEQ2_9NEOP|nr:unnamed protein product [Leptidea sinapis]
MPVPNFLKQPLSVYMIAEQYWDLKAYPTQYVFALLALVSEDKLERDKCIELSSPEGQEEWLNYCRRPRRTILELTIDVLFELFSTIKPRSFSIASSCVPAEVVEYSTKIKKPRLGLCSNWMKHLDVGRRLYGWINKGVFKFPEPNVPLILIGPGTGLAPFRSLIQDRIARGVAGNIHLFFGCRYKEKDFLCRHEIEKWETDGHVVVYVQHKISEHRNTLRDLILSGAHIYVSGNSKNMPDNVRDSFIENVLCDLEDAKGFVKNMVQTGRYQTETW